MAEGVARPSRELIRRGPFARLWWASSASSLGDWVTLFATFSLATKIAGGQGATVAILIPLGARILPGLVLGMFAGVAADRWHRKRTMVVADFGRAALVASYLLIDDFSRLFIITFAVEVLSLLRQPAREAVVPTLIDQSQLLRANGLNLASAYGTAPLGSLLFAALTEFGNRLPDMGSFGPAIATAFLFDAATFLVSGIVVLTVPIARTPLSRSRRTTGRFNISAPMRDLAEGFRFVTTNPGVRRTVLGMATALFGGGAVFVLGQPFSELVLGGGDSGYGLVVTALGVGVGLGMIAVTVVAPVHREVVYSVGLAGTGLAIVFAALTKTVWGASGWTLVAGAGTGVAYVTGFTRLHELVTDDLRGRTFAALFSLGRAALLVSFALAGVGAAALDGRVGGVLGEGIRFVLTLSGVVILTAGLGTVWVVRRQLVPKPFDKQAYESLRDAGDAFTIIRGDRRSDR
jgi:dTMP kinase